MSTIGTVSELVTRKLKTWRSGAIRELLQLESSAKRLRDLLEEDPQVDLSGLGHEISDIHSSVLTLISYYDRAAGLAEAGL